MLSAEEIERFIADGFVCVRGAFSRATADQCRAILLKMAGVTDDPATWTKPVVRVESASAPPFVEAANGPRLVEALDQLVGTGRWIRRMGLGTFPIRFPHAEEPIDAGWHVDASFATPGSMMPWLNVRSRGRALLMLFLFTDVGPDDAPTRIKVGSHADVAPVLAEAGEAGLEFFDLCRRLATRGLLDNPARETAYATGQAGDVYLCHPFLVHAGQRHRGTTPRVIAQPPLDPVGLFDLEHPTSPVERAVAQAL